MRKIMLLVPAVILVAGAAWAASSQDAPKPDGASTVALVNQDARLGNGPEGIYSRTCGYCHGANVGPIILGLKLPAELIRSTVRTGQGAMPAFRSTEISDADLKGLSDWISDSPADTHEHGK
jgi:mono/diheme cytochrome c family protein